MSAYSCLNLTMSYSTDQFKQAAINQLPASKNLSKDQTDQTNWKKMSDKSISWTDLH